MRRGDLHVVDLEPVRRGEMGKARPCLILSDGAFNSASTSVLVVPISSYPPGADSMAIRGSAPTGLNHDSSLLPLHIRAIAKSRIGRRIGRAPVSVVEQAVEMLKLIIDPP
jgi:mRNA interferase MazF